MCLCVCFCVLLCVCLCVPPVMCFCLFPGVCSVRYTWFYGCIPRVSIRYFRWNSFYLPGGFVWIPRLGCVWFLSGSRLDLCLFLGGGGVRYPGFYGCIPQVCTECFRWNFYSSCPRVVSGSLVSLDFIVCGLYLVVKIFYMMQARVLHWVDRARGLSQARVGARVLHWVIWPGGCLRIVPCVGSRFCAFSSSDGLCNYYWLWSWVYYKSGLDPISCS